MKKRPKPTKGYSEFKTNSDKFNKTDKPIKKLLYCDSEKNYVYITKQIGDSRLAECYSFLAKKAQRKGFKNKKPSAMKKFLKNIDINEDNISL